MNDAELEANLIVCSSALSACERLGLWIRRCFGSPGHPGGFLGPSFLNLKVPCYFLLASKMFHSKERSCVETPEIAYHLSYSAHSASSRQTLRDFFVLVPNNIILSTSIVGGMTIQNSNCTYQVTFCSCLIINSVA